MRGNHVVLRALRTLAGSLVVPEEEQPVAHDRPAKRAAELIAAQVGFGKAVALVEERIRAPRVAAVESEYVTAKAVGPRRCNHPDGRGTARRVDAGNGRRDREFAYRVGRRTVGAVVERVGANEVVLDVDAVLRDLRPGRTSAVDRGFGAIWYARHAGLQSNQRQRVAIIERQLGNLALHHCLRHFRCRRLHQRAAAADRDRLAQLTDLQPRRQ